MSDLLPVADAATIPTRDDAIEPSGPGSELLVDQLLLDWPTIVFRIMLAGGAYPVVLAAGYLLLTVVQLPRELGEIVMAALFASAIGGVVGLFLTGAVILVTLPLLHAFVWSLKLRGSIIWLSAFYGGLVGFVAVMPFVMQVPLFSDTRELESLIALMVGPGLTTILGQLGGAWGGWRVGWYRRAVGRAAPHLIERHYPNVADMQANPNGSTSARIQFQIRHLLWIGVWVSLLLTLIRLSGIPYHFVLPLLIGWLIYQAATLWIGGRLLQQIKRWRAERQIRST